MSLSPTDRQPLFPCPSPVLADPEVVFSPRGKSGIGSRLSLRNATISLLVPCTRACRMNLRGVFLALVWHMISLTSLGLQRFKSLLSARARTMGN